MINYDILNWYYQFQYHLDRITAKKQNSKGLILKTVIINI